MKQKPSLRTLIRHINSGSGVGYCIHCWHSQHGVEPDARGYLCSKCGNRTVYGCEELLPMLEVL